MPENRKFVRFSAVGYNAKDFLTLQTTTLINSVADNAKLYISKTNKAF